jgi:hypothetical protein
VAVGEGDIALDAIMQLEDPTFDHVLGHFEAYLSSIDASHRPSITDVDMAVDVMEAAELSRAGAATEIARRMPAEMLIRDINAVPATLLPFLLNHTDSPSPSRTSRTSSPYAPWTLL